MSDWPSRERWLRLGIVRGLLLGGLYGGATAVWVMIGEPASAGGAVTAIAFTSLVGMVFGFFAGLLVGILLSWAAAIRRVQSITPNLFALGCLALGGATTSIVLVLATLDIRAVLYAIVGPVAFGMVSLLIRPFTGERPKVRTPAPEM